jgi:hypothetical protein
MSSYLDSDNGQWRSLVKNKSVDNREIHFTGRYLEFTRWLIFCIEVNFASFFAGATNEGGGLQSLMQMVAPTRAKSAASDSGTASNTG